MRKIAALCCSVLFISAEEYNGDQQAGMDFSGSANQKKYPEQEKPVGRHEYYFCQKMTTWALPGTDRDSSPQGCGVTGITNIVSIGVSLVRIKHTRAVIQTIINRIKIQISFHPWKATHPHAG